MNLKVGLYLACAVTSFPHVYSASTFMAPRHAALVGEAAHAVHQEKEMPKTEHQKTPGKGYEKGSPLYDKQQQRIKDGKVSDASPPGAVPAVVPPPPTSRSLCAQAFTWKGFTYFLSYVIMTLFFGLFWMKCWGGRTIKGWRERPNMQNGFSYGLFAPDHCIRGGEHHCSICFCAWCCAPLRIADTWSKDPMPLVKGFWVALLLVALLMGLGPFTCNFSILVFFVLAIVMRQKMRKQYGIENGTVGTWVEDTVTWLFCSCCAVAQEARQSEFCVKKDDPNPDTGAH